MYCLGLAVGVAQETFIGKHSSGPLRPIIDRLSKRQRQLYEEYMASSETRSTLASGSFLGIINVLMQLRKCCNHPDLFEGRPIISAFDMEPLTHHLPSLALHALPPTLPSNLQGLSITSLEPQPAWAAARSEVGLLFRSNVLCLL